MPRRFLKQLSAEYRASGAASPWYLHPFRALLAHPVYFALNRRNVTRAVALGLFIGVLPFLGHMAIALLIGLWLRVNLPVTVLATWAGNPLTYPPLFYGEYLVGRTILGLPPASLDTSLPWREIVAQLASAWQPLWVGGLVVATAIAAVGYLATNAAWRAFTVWRFRRRSRVEA
jgi:hypothetical protein